jgi:hypothetical protein
MKICEESEMYFDVPCRSSSSGIWWCRCRCCTLNLSHLRRRTGINWKEYCDQNCAFDFIEREGEEYFETEAVLCTALLEAPGFLELKGAGCLSGWGIFGSLGSSILLRFSPEVVSFTRFGMLFSFRRKGSIFDKIKKDDMICETHEKKRKAS